jgi:hypothetical protein
MFSLELGFENLPKSVVGFDVFGMNYIVQNHYKS